MDEINDKALVAAYKKLRGKLGLDFVKLSIRGIFLPVLHMKTQDMVGAVYIGNVCMAEYEFLSVGHDMQGFLRGGDSVGSLCQNFRQTGKAYRLDQIIERIEVKCLPVKIFAGGQKD